MQNFLMMAKGIAQTSGFRTATGNRRVGHIDVRDVGARAINHLQPISYDDQKQAMIDVGLPESVAEDNARAVALMADGDCDYVTEDVT
jgi:hypothetical protein